MPQTEPASAPDFVAFQKRIEQLKNPTVIDILLQVEDLFDSMDLYAFKNWINGRLVEGPEIRRHWVRCAFLYPEQFMPDPFGALRLLKAGVRVYYETAMEEHYRPIDIDNPPRGPRKPHHRKVWIIHFLIPRRLLDDISDQTLEAFKDIVNVDDLLDKQDQKEASEQNEGGPGGGENLGGEPILPVPPPGTGTANEQPPAPGPAQ